MAIAGVAAALVVGAGGAAVRRARAALDVPERLPDPGHPSAARANPRRPTCAVLPASRGSRAPGPTCRTSSVRPPRRTRSPSALARRGGWSSGTRCSTAASIVGKSTWSWRTSSATSPTTTAEARGLAGAVPAAGRRARGACSRAGAAGSRGPRPCPSRCSSSSSCSCSRRR